MRENWAKGLAVTTALLLIAVSGLMAWAQNPPVDTTAADGTAAVVAGNEAADGSRETIEKGMAVYQSQDCLSCHSIAGQGSPRSPLDGVGARLSAPEIRDWIIADESLQDELAPRVITAKTRYRELPEADLDALVAYLETLK